jgi:hypothetical protein
LRESGDCAQSEYKHNQAFGDGQYFLVQFLGRGGSQRMNSQWTRTVKENFVRYSGCEISRAF